MDVTEGQQFYAEMVWAVDSGAMRQTSDRRFRPLEQVTRAEMAQVLYQVGGAPPYTPPAQSPFNDVATSSPDYKAIAWIASKGISTGWSDRTFRPGLPVARDAVSAFMYRLSGSPEWQVPDVSPFTDVTPTTQFYAEMTWLRAMGISTGWPDGTFRPLNSTTRDAMAAFAKRLSATVAAGKGVSDYLGVVDATWVDDPSVRRAPSGTTGTTASAAVGTPNTAGLETVAAVRDILVEDDAPVIEADSSAVVLGQQLLPNGNVQVQVQASVTTYFEYGERLENFASGSFQTDPHTITLSPSGQIISDVVIAPAQPDNPPVEGNRMPVLPSSSDMPAGGVAPATVQPGDSPTLLPQRPGGGGGMELQYEPDYRYPNLAKMQIWAHLYTWEPPYRDCDSCFPAPYRDQGNNCTNFISQILREGGTPLRGGVNTRDSSNWHYDLTGPAGASYTWNAANWNYDYVRRNLRQYSHLDNIWNAPSGSLLYVDWDPKGRPDGEVDHVMFVLEGAGGQNPEPIITQRSAPRNQPLSHTMATLKADKRPAVWYGLKYNRSIGG